MHPTVVVGIAGLVAGLILGTIYGRKAEQKIVGTAIAEFDKAGRIPQAVLNSLHSRLTYLKKYL